VSGSPADEAGGAIAVAPEGKLMTEFVGSVALWVAIGTVVFAAIAMLLPLGFGN
jgi:hypothetical protein